MSKSRAKKEDPSRSGRVNPKGNMQFYSPDVKKKIREARK